MSSSNAVHSPKFSPPSVGLFGYYDYGNFGDDLMAVMIGRHLQSLGINFTIWGNPKLYQECYGWSSTRSIKELVERSQIVVVGGGGLLVPSVNSPKHFDLCLDELLTCCRQRGIPLYAISIGGIGEAISRIRPSMRSRLATSAAYVTVRNREDLAAFRDINVPAEFHQDIVWTVPFFYRRFKKKYTGRRIGINLYPGSPHYCKNLLAIIMKAIFRFRRNYEFVFVDTHSTGKEFQAFCLLARGKNCSKWKFCELEKDIEFIQGLDLVITCKLHLAVAAMSFGIPCISFLGRTKSSILYRSLGLHRLCWGVEGYLNLLSLFFLPHKIDRIVSKMREFDTSAMLSDGMNHFQKLTELIHGKDNVRI